jgi:hypothetical protein
LRLAALRQSGVVLDVETDLAARAERDGDARRAVRDAEAGSARDIRLASVGKGNPTRVERTRTEAHRTLQQQVDGRKAGPPRDCVAALQLLASGIGQLRQQQRIERSAKMTGKCRV